MSDSQLERKITLELTKVPYHNPAKNAFAILKGIIRGVDEYGKPDAIGKILTAKGNIHNPVVGAHYTLTGTAKWEPDFNEHQFCFTTYEVNQTATATGTQNYLAKECPGIGEGRAKQLVELFGTKTLEMLAKAENISFVSGQLPGLDVQQATEIYNWAVAESVLLPVKQKLYEAGMTQGLIRTLTKNYGTKTEQVLREDCFGITCIKGIAFATADKIGKKFGMVETNPKRLRQGVLHALSEVMDDKGHTCVEHHILINAACELLTVHKSHVIEIMKQMIKDGDLCTDKTDPKAISKTPELFEEIQPLRQPQSQPPPSQPPQIQPPPASPSKTPLPAEILQESKPLVLDTKLALPTAVQSKESEATKEILSEVQAHILTPPPASPHHATLVVVEEASEFSAEVLAKLAEAPDLSGVDTRTIYLMAPKDRSPVPFPPSPSLPTTSPPPVQPPRRSARRS